MPIHRVIKRSREEFQIYGDFTTNIESAEILVDSTLEVAATDKNGNDVSDTLLIQSTLDMDSTEDIASITLTGGSEDLSPYEVVFYAETNLGNKWEIVVEIIIDD